MDKSFMSRSIAISFLEHRGNNNNKEHKDGKVCQEDKTHLVTKDLQISKFIHCIFVK